MKVLIADDDPLSLKLLESLLTQEGFDVALAHTGDIAWQILQSEDGPQMAVMDWLMPGMDGLEVCRKVRKRDCDRDNYTYVVILTVKGQHDDLVEAMDAGADDYIVKPFDPQELKVRLRAGRRVVDLQRALVERTQLLQNVAYALTHDLQAPLMALGMILNQALEGAHGQLPEDLCRVLGNAKSSNEELLRLVDRLMRVAQLAENHSFYIPATIQPVDIYELVLQCRSELEPLWAGKEHSISVESHCPDNRIAGVRPELRRLIINLLDNAIKYTPVKGSIDVLVVPADHCLRVLIKDSGYGIPEEDRPHLFSRFWQAGKAKLGVTTRLGLYLCRSIVEAHGGTIGYQASEGGSAFVIELPRRIGLGARQEVGSAKD
ncbi:MAG: response regulator [Candidatus Melainabacteria bacterium]|nr:response regulator [Candidatus Melainabacteria bacterium]